jgi:thymidylate synthase (FAD)
MARIKVECIDAMGSDLTVVNAARVSFDKRSETLTPADVRLIGYLADHGHWTPFAHPQLSFRIRAPIFVRAQLFKHKVGLTENEVSRRYVATDPQVLDGFDWRPAPSDRKQGSDPGVLTTPILHATYEAAIDVALSAYDALIANGVAPEQARMVLPLATMTEWVWTGSLAAFARVAQLRLQPDAQAETAQVVEEIARFARNLFPVCMAALMDTRLKVAA